MSFSFRGNNYIREAMHAVFLYHAIQQGMDFGIVNPASKVTYDEIPKEHLCIIEDVVLNKSDDASERLIELADKVRAEKEKEKAAGVTSAASASHQQWRDKTVEERLQYALKKGIGDYIEADIHEALENILAQ